MLPDDVGLYLKDAISAHFKSVGKPANVKYIDPSYIIRSAPANAADSNLCTTLAFNCVHGAMAGRTGVHVYVALLPRFSRVLYCTGFTVGMVDNVAVWLPITVVSSMPPRKVDPDSRIYARLCNCTGQPFLGEAARYTLKTAAAAVSMSVLSPRRKSADEGAVEIATK